MRAQHDRRFGPGAIGIRQNLRVKLDRVLATVQKRIRDVCLHSSRKAHEPVWVQEGELDGVVGNRAQVPSAKIIA